MKGGPAVFAGLRREGFSAIHRFKASVIREGFSVHAPARSLSEQRGFLIHSHRASSASLARWGSTETDRTIHILRYSSIVLCLAVEHSTSPATGVDAGRWAASESPRTAHTFLRYALCQSGRYQAGFTINKNCADFSGGGGCSKPPPGPLHRQRTRPIAVRHRVGSWEAPVLLPDWRYHPGVTVIRPGPSTLCAL
jgi:hypothetical protein